MRERHRQDWEPSGVAAGFLKAVKAVLNGDELRDFWPVTLRGVHYAMLDAPRVQIGVDKQRKPAFYENTTKSYKALGRLLATARLSGEVPWRAIADNHREVMDGGKGFTDAVDFIAFSQRDFLTGYSRNCLATQTLALEVWVEKDTIARFVHEVASEYQLPVVVARGYGSVSFVNDLRGRVNDNRDDDKTTRVLYFGDLDPSGVNMLTTMFTTLYDEMDVSRGDVDYVRCGINEEHVKRFKLKPNPDALKDDDWQDRQRQLGNTDKTKGDPRAEAYKAEYGKVAVELDALGPRRLQDLVRAAIIDNLDMDALEREREQEAKDIRRIDKMRAKVAKLLKE